MVAPSGITIGDLTLHGARKGGATTFVNLARSGRAGNLLRWRSKVEGEQPSLTPDNCGVMIFTDAEQTLPDFLEPKKEYSIGASCSISPSKNWALVVPTAELFEIADVSALMYVVPGDVHSPVFRIKPRFKISREEILNITLAYALLLA